ncbi:hypothetical protein [Paenibacillus peoriae]|nr:hypothetical protein [Paenibacillus peoriae]
MAKYLYRLGLWSVRNRIKVMIGGLMLVDEMEASTSILFRR